MECGHRERISFQVGSIYYIISFMAVSIKSINSYRTSLLILMIN